MILILQPNQVFIDVLTPQSVLVVATDTEVETVGGLDPKAIQEKEDIVWMWALEGEGLWDFRVRDDTGPDSFFRVEIQRDEKNRWLLFARDLRSPNTRWDFMLPKYDPSKAGPPEGLRDRPTIWDHITDAGFA